MSEGSPKSAEPSFCASSHPFGAVPIEERLEDYQRALRETYPDDDLVIETVDVPFGLGIPHKEARLVSPSGQFGPDELDFKGSGVMATFTRTMQAERGRG